MFAEAAFQLWRAAGRIAHVRSSLRAGLPTPNTKTKAMQHSSERTGLYAWPQHSELIGTALKEELNKHYCHPPRQWGFQTDTNTECPISFATNEMRRHRQLATILDLKKAYDRVPRKILQDMLDEPMPSVMSTALWPLLFPIVLVKKHQKTNACATKLVGMTQGDAPSPYFYIIFMDDYIATVKHTPSRGLSTLFVDDVMILARILLGMKNLIQTWETWATKVQMEWTALKSCGLKLHRMINLTR